MSRIRDRAEITKVQVVDTFSQMVEGVMSAVQRMANAFKGGSFLDKLAGVIGVVTQVAGAFGGSKAFGGFRANGGPISAGRPYLVGERGPELVVPHRNGVVIPNEGLGSGAAQVEIVDTTNLFRFRVNGQIMEAAPSIASAGARGGFARMQRSATRRIA